MKSLWRTFLMLVQWSPIVPILLIIVLGIATAQLCREASYYRLNQNPTGVYPGLTAEQLMGEER